MAPSIRVTQDVYNGLKVMIEEQGYAKTPNGVIDRFLREEGVMPSEPSVAQNIVFQQVGKNKAESTTASSFSETEVKEFRKLFGEPIPIYRFQRDAMRDIYKKCCGDKDKAIRAYAWLEENGHTLRKNNSYNFSPLYYAEALFHDGMKKGWLSEAE